MLLTKVIVITGAANGLGRALAVEFYRRGCHLALIDIDMIGLAISKSELEIKDQPISIHEADVSNEQSIVLARVEIVAIHKHIDVLINNAGVSISQKFEQLDLKHYKELMDINFWGTVYGTKYFLPDLKQRKESRIVNIVSCFAFMGFPGKTAYGSSKSAIVGFSHSLKTELIHETVKVCLVVPPPLDTGLVKNSKHGSDKNLESEAKFLERHGRPLDRTTKVIVNQIVAGKYRIIVGSWMKGIDIMVRLFPALSDFLIKRVKNQLIL